MLIHVIRYSKLTQTLNHHLLVETYLPTSICQGLVKLPEGIMSRNDAWGFSWRCGRHAPRLAAPPVAPSLAALTRAPLLVGSSSQRQALLGKVR